MDKNSRLWIILAIAVFPLILLFLGYYIDLRMDRNRTAIDQLEEQTIEAIQDLESMALRDINVATGQEVYVPAYSAIRGLEGRNVLNLSINLSIRNTDPEQSIVLSYLNFYDTEGQIVRQFIEEPLRIGPMATKEFHVRKSDKSGGIGANFYLQWVADTMVNEPLIEAVMLGNEGTQGYSWVSESRVVKTLQGDAAE